MQEREHRRIWRVGEAELTGITADQTDPAAALTKAQVAEKRKEREQEIILRLYLDYARATHDLLNSFVASQRFFLAALLGLFIGLSWVLQIDVDPLPGLQFYLVKLGCLIGMALSVVWYLFLRYHNKMRQAKYEVLHVMEMQLPCHCYRDEWEFYCHPHKITHNIQRGFWARLFFTWGQWLVPLMTLTLFFLVYFYLVK